MVILIVSGIYEVKSCYLRVSLIMMLYIVTNQEGSPQPYFQEC